MSAQADDLLLARNRSGLAPTLSKLATILNAPSLPSLTVDSETSESPELENMYRAVVDEAAREIQRVLPARSRCPREKTALLLKGFRRRLRARWAMSLNRLELLHTLAFEIGAEFNHCARNAHNVADPLMLDTLIRIHGRGCRVFQEVLLLLSNGYADGALARWRSLHEASITAGFILKHGVKAAEAYCAHEVIESYRVATEYADHQAALGLSPISAAELSQLQQAFDEACQTYGEPFKTQFGWAAFVLNKPRMGIEALEDAAGLSHLRPYYRMASHDVHSNPKSIRFSIARPTHSPAVMITGPTNTGLADPGQCAAISLTQLTAYLLSMVATWESTVLLIVLDSITDQVCAELAATQRKIEESATDLT